MNHLPFYLVTLGIPIVLYGVWLAWLTGRIRFFVLWIAMIFAVWIVLWPVYYSPKHLELSDQSGDLADTVVNGFILMGWVNGLIGSIPILLIETPRSIVLLMRKRRLEYNVNQKTMKSGKNDRHVAAILTLVAGTILAASGVMAFVEAARQNHGVSRFLLGYTLLWSGITIVGQIRYSKILTQIMKLTSSSNPNQTAGKDMETTDNKVER